MKNNLQFVVDDARKTFRRLLKSKRKEIEAIFEEYLTVEEKHALNALSYDSQVSPIELFENLASNIRFNICENESKNLMEAFAYWYRNRFEDKVSIYQIYYSIRHNRKPRVPSLPFEEDYLAGKVLYKAFVKYIRAVVHYLELLVFNGLLVDLQDPNVSIDYGSLGTPGRIAKMLVGKNAEDLTEPLSGRFAIEPELVIFPARDHEKGMPVTVSVTLNAVCSHHLFRFGNEFGNPSSKVIISYIPQEKVLGLSKINRWVDWVARRGWLQEDLTSYLGKELMKRVETKDIYVGLINLQHGCVAFRGKNDAFAYTTTEFFSGKYEDAQFRKEVIGSYL